MAEEAAGFREIDHTADWELEIWAPDFEELLTQAAQGMYEMSGIEYGTEVQATRRFELEQPDRETLLVGFLSELLYLLQTARLAFERFTFEVEQEEDRTVVSVLAVGQPVKSIEKEIKAVTWHDISVRETDEGFEGRVTFDV